MTDATKTAKILNVIAARGWFTTEIYWNEAQALKAAGLIKMDTKYTTGGYIKLVWIAA